MNKKSISVVFIIIVIIALLIISMVLPQKNGESKKSLLGINYNIKGNESSLKYDTNNPVVAMHIENYGSIVIELYPEIAPNTVNNFIHLVKTGFYDNNTFHRLVKGFVLQGGDPNGTGSGGPGYEIKGEFNSNGFANNLSHEKNVVSMAREGANYDSAGSQFFICLEDAKYLDGNYAAFGRIIDGFSNIDKIVEEEEIENEQTGKLKRNLKIEKAIIDLKGEKYPEVEKIN